MSEIIECTCNPGDWVDTDNTAVIRALEKRVEELGAVAEAAKRYLTKNDYDGLLQALYAAGYLK